MRLVQDHQRPDLLDREDLGVSVVRAISMDHGFTELRRGGPSKKEIVRDGLCTLGELMRSSQLQLDYGDRHPAWAGQAPERIAWAHPP
jgi:hypothetical protein